MTAVLPPSLPRDLENLVLEEGGIFDIDVTEEIDLLFGKHVLAKLKSGATTGNRRQLFHSHYPQSFLHSFAVKQPPDYQPTTVTSVESLRIAVSKDVAVDEKFLLEHCEHSSILDHPALSHPELLKAIDRDIALGDEMSANFACRKGLDPQIILDRQAAINKGKVNPTAASSLMVMRWVNLTDEFASSNIATLAQCRDLSSHPNLSPTFLIDNASKLWISSLGNHPRCREVLDFSISGREESKEILAEFLADSYRWSNCLGPWFFEQNPGELHEGRIDHYVNRMSVSDHSIEFILALRPYRHQSLNWHWILLHPEIAHATDVYGELVHELFRERGPKLVSELSFTYLTRRYNSNPSISLDILELYKHLIPIEYGPLSCNPALPVEAVLRLANKLDIAAVLRHNHNLPRWLMARAMRRRLDAK